MKLRSKWIITVLLTVFVVVPALLYLLRWAAPEGPVVQFLGAAREVGGSCHLVETADSRFIVDCGLFGEAGKGILPDEPDGLSFVLLTHAHGDHCGLLPELYAGGFRGKVFCTEPTAGLVPIMLRMSRSLSRKKVPADDFKRAIEGLVPVPYREIVDVGTVSFRFRRAGHLLGSAFVEVWIDCGRGNTKLVFSGDIGSGNSILLSSLEALEEADYVVMESTYGGTARVHGGSGDSYGGTVRGHEGSGAVERHRAFAEAVGEAVRRGGDVLIPAFTLGRTQEVIAAIDIFSRMGVIPTGTLTYVDSPTAKKITKVYRRFRGELSAGAAEFYRGEMLRFAALREVKSRISLKVHSRNHRPAVFVSSSGDLDHANSPRHFMEMFDGDKNLLCIVGWQSPGSLGSRLSAGESPVLVRCRSGKRYLKEWVSPALEVRRFDSFSAHADQAGLVEWLAGARGIKKVFLVHGEPDHMEALAEIIRKKMGLNVEIPGRGERFLLHVSDDSIAGKYPVGRVKDLLDRNFGAVFTVLNSPVRRPAVRE